ncbi:MAG TPA: glycosyltransferase family 1 protein [Thermoanaerobaculia bacterium]|nr:glycosyltransferase family 1 protein [Thermoanaerobaculia bacterium]
MNLVQIVPQLAPVPDGVGGYATALAQGLARECLASRFLVAASSEPAAADGGLPGTAALSARQHSAHALARLLAESGAELALVHYVNYGYHPRGCPSWLVDGVARWRAAARGRRLVTMFHEVYASGPPWRSSFWLSPVQRRLAARLLHASDGAATSLGLYARMLDRWRPRQAVVVAPVFSAVGEPAELPAPEERRPRRLVVFGGAGNRRRAYGELRQLLAAACQALEVAEIVDLGPAIDEVPESLAGLPVRALGSRPEGEVSAILRRAYAGFLAYPTPFLPKSTVFAAYCAHGLVPVCAWPHRVRQPALERPPCWDAGAEAAPADPAALAARARTWYAGHDLARQAAAFRALLCEAQPGTRASQSRVATGGPQTRAGTRAPEDAGTERES